MTATGRVGVVGPLLGERPGWVDSPGLALAGHLAAEGTEVRTTSRSPGRLRRAAEVGSVALRWRRRIDVGVVMVFSGGAFVVADLGLRACRAAGAATVAWLHGGGLPDLAERRPDAVRGVLERADAVVAPSPWLARWSATLGVEACTIPNVVEPPAPFRRRAALRPRLLWMRTYHELYDPLLALDAFALLAADVPGATLTMAGQDKGLASTVRSEVDRRGLGGVVEVRGLLDREAKARAFADHDLFLSTNRVDNAPVTLVEAGAAGLPVVALDVGGVADLLDHGEGGVLVGQATPTAVAEAVAALLRDPGRAGALSEAGRRRGEAHRWDRVGPAWNELLTALARG